MPRLSKYQFYCVKCRKPSMPEGNIFTHGMMNNRNGKQHAMCANCKTCNTKMFKFVDEKLINSLPKSIEYYGDYN